METFVDLLSVKVKFLILASIKVESSHNEAQTFLYQNRQASIF